jgi:ketosteroid isomerase-like protein
MSEVVDRLIGALNAHDLEGAAALFHEGYRSEQPAHPARAFTGRSQTRANWAAIFAGIPDFHAETVSSVDSGDTTWSEWSWTGNRTDGKPFHVRGVVILTIEDSLITAGRLYLEDVERDGGGIEDAVEARSGRRPVR